MSISDFHFLTLFFLLKNAFFGQILYNFSKILSFYTKIFKNRKREKTSI